MDELMDDEIKDNDFFFDLGLAVLDLSYKDYKREQRNQTDPDLYNKRNLIKVGKDYYAFQ